MRALVHRPHVVVGTHDFIASLSPATLCLGMLGYLQYKLAMLIVGLSGSGDDGDERR